MRLATDAPMIFQTQRSGWVQVKEVVQIMSKTVAGKTHGRTPDHPP